MQAPKWFSQIPIFVLVAALFLILLPLPWSIVRTPEGGKQMGAVSYEIDAHLTPWKADYNVTARVGEGGLLGGFGGGNNITVEGERYYVTGGAEALEDIGIIYDSYKVKEGRIRIKAREGFVNLTVRVEVDMIPFYREGSDITVRVLTRVEEALVAFKEIRVEGVKIILKRHWSDDALTYLKNTTLRFDPGVKNTIYDLNDALKWELKVKMPKGEGRVGVTALLDISFKDSEGREEDYIVTSAPNPINLYPVTTSQFVSLFGLAAAGLEGTAGALLALLAPLIRRRGRLKRGLQVAGAVLLLVSPLHFVSSVGTIGDLLALRISGAKEMISLTAIPYALLALAALHLILVLLGVLGILKLSAGEKEEEMKEEERGEGPSEKEEALSEGLFRRVE